MAFTYDITTDRGKVRFNLGDYTENKGPRPRKTNFSDAEIDYLLTTQGNSINKSVAMGLDALGNEWLAYSISQKEADLAYDAKGLAESFFKRAAWWWATPDGEIPGSLTTGILTYDFAEHGGDGWSSG